MEMSYLCHLMKKITLIAILLLTLCLGASGQYFYGGLGYTFPRTHFVADSSGNIRFQTGDIGFTMQAGAFAGSNLKGASWYGTNVSPALAYNLTPRFRLKTGVSITQGFGDGFYSGYDGYPYPVNASGTTIAVFVQGDYILSNRVMLSGAAYKYFSPYSLNTSDPRLRNPEGEGFMFNINYHPTDNFQINASFEYGNGPGYRSGSPFYQPFHPGF